MMSLYRGSGENLCFSADAAKEVSAFSFAVGYDFKTSFPASKFERHVVVVHFPMILIGLGKIFSVFFNQF